MRAALGLFALVGLAGCLGPTAPSEPTPTADPTVEPGALRTADGEPIVVVVETRDRSIAVTADLVEDPSRGDLRELRAPRVMADVDVDLLSHPATSP